jgi:hypothetical protein
MRPYVSYVVEKNLMRSYVTYVVKKIMWCSTKSV